MHAKTIKKISLEIWFWAQQLGLLGNEISDGKGVGTIGGIIGAKIAADNSQSNSREIAAYSEEERCETIRSYEKEYVEEYSYSYITFELDGRRYRARFTR